MTLPRVWPATGKGWRSEDFSRSLRPTAGRGDRWRIHANAKRPPEAAVLHCFNLETPYRISIASELVTVTGLPALVTWAVWV